MWCIVSIIVRFASNSKHNEMITKSFSQFADDLISRIPFDISDLKLDHFGYQASSAQDYKNLKDESLSLGNLISENIVGGRRVGIFLFHKDLIYKNFRIKGFELVEPKQGQICQSQLDHLEFVIF